VVDDVEYENEVVDVAIDLEVDRKVWECKIDVVVRVYDLD
jgi:hypothetical protein